MDRFRIIKSRLSNVIGWMGYITNEL